MGQVLTRIQGNNDREYNIIKGDDGVTYCTCPAWKFRSPAVCACFDTTPDVYSSSLYVDEMQEAISRALSML